jgi:UDP-glucose 4-epimerase
MVDANKLAGERVLVTGASGFIGSHLCRHLSQAGAEVHAISRVSRESDEHVCRWWQGDLADPDTVRDILALIQPTLIFHLASLVAGAREMTLVMPMLRNNLLSTVNVLTAAATLRCRRLIFAGSLEEPEAGDLEAVPCSPYAAAKWASSAYTRMYYALYQLPVVMARIFMVYGPAQQDLRKLIPYVTISLLRGEPPLLGNGQRPIDWIYIDDVIEGLITLSQVDGIDGMTIDIGSGTLVTIQTIVETLTRLVNPQIVPVFGALADRPLEQVRVANIIRSLDLLAWRPQTCLEEGLRRTAAWYDSQLKGIP